MEFTKKGDAPKVKRPAIVVTTDYVQAYNLPRGLGAYLKPGIEGFYREGSDKYYFGNYKDEKINWFNLPYIPAKFVVISDKFKVVSDEFTIEQERDLNDFFEPKLPIIDNYSPFYNW